MNRGQVGQEGKPADDLPVVDWEIPEERKRVLKDIQPITRAISQIVRVDYDTYAKQRRKYRDTVGEYEAFTIVIQSWAYYRKQRPDESRSGTGERWQFVQFIQREGESEVWPLLTVLEKQVDGSLKLITTHRRQQCWVKIWMQRADVQRRR